MRLLKTIKDKEPAHGVVAIKREASRAVLFDANGLVPILFVSKHNFHKLPGGGVEGDENEFDTLRREVMEETGCEIEIQDEVGKIQEYRAEYNLEQTSNCYFGKVLSKQQTNFTAKELADDFKLVWLTLDDAIDALSKDEPNSYEGLFIQKRDLIFLQEVKKIITVNSLTHPALSYPREDSDNKTGTKRSDIKPGIKVAIVLKKDQPTGKLTEGLVQNILTSSSDHHRGIKVRLTDGQVGRVQKIL